MASTRDILDGQRFNRQRLVTAFVSGMPGGREMTPVRPWRGIIGGIVLTALLVGGAWVSKLFAPSMPDGWDHGALVIDSKSGSRYVSIDGTLYPVRNAASAYLLFGANLTTVDASESALSEAPLGPVVGIPGAPDKVPSADNLVDTLTSCVAEGGHTWTGVGTGTTQNAEGTMALVKNGEDYYLIADGYRYAFQQTNFTTDQAAAARAVMNEFGFPYAQATDAPSAWLNLFKEGEALVPLEIDDVGKPAGTIEGLGEVDVGTILRVSNAPNEGDTYLVRPGPVLEPMTPVMEHMYAMSAGGETAKTMEITTAQLSRATLASDQLRSTWPDDITALITEPHSACAQLTPDGTSLVIGTNVPHVSTDTVQIASQSGALVAEPGDSGSLYFLIDEDGLAYQLGSYSDTAESFGYSDVTPLRATSAWVSLFSSDSDTEMPLLSGSAAWATVPEEARESQSSGGSSSS